MYISFFNMKDLQMKKLFLLGVVVCLPILSGCWKKKEEAKVEPVTTEAPAAPVTPTEQPAAPAAPVAETAPAAPTAPATTPVSK